jgi:hemolysin activation/secretion protein
MLARPILIVPQEPDVATLDPRLRLRLKQQQQQQQQQPKMEESAAQPPSQAAPQLPAPSLPQESESTTSVNTVNPELMSMLSQDIAAPKQVSRVHAFVLKPTQLNSQQQQDHLIRCFRRIATLAFSSTQQSKVIYHTFYAVFPA